VRRHSPEGIEKLERFIQQWNIVGVSTKELPVPYGDHQVTFRRADGMLVYVSLPYQGWPAPEQWDAYLKFALDHHLSGSVSPGTGWWGENTSLVTFATEPGPGRDLYYLELELADWQRRCLECLRLSEEMDAYDLRRRMRALRNEAMRLGCRVDRAFAEMEAADARA
jgi:hypothetical protein